MTSDLRPSNYDSDPPTGSPPSSTLDLGCLYFLVLSSLIRLPDGLSGPVSTIFTRVDKQVVKDSGTLHNVCYKSCDSDVPVVLLETEVD